METCAAKLSILALATVLIPSLAAGGGPEGLTAYQQTLAEFGYRPSGEGATELLRAWVPSQAARDRVAQLVRALDVDDFLRREEATRKLLAMPNSAIDRLRLAAERGSAEVRWRARHVLRQAEDRQARLLLAALQVIAEDHRLERWWR